MTRLPAWSLFAAALAMPGIAWLSQRGAFGPDNATIAERYPTLLMASGYAFSIWGLIFTLDLVLAWWQTRRPQRDDPVVVRWRPWAIAGFVLTAAWMVAFPQEAFGLALAIIWAAWAAMARAAIIAGEDVQRAAALPRAVLALHAGWLTLAAFLNTAQVVVAYEWAPTDLMLPWTLGLWAAAAALVLWLLWWLRGALAYAAVVTWGLVAIVVEQSNSPLQGSAASALVAAVLIAVVAALTLWMWRRRAVAPLTLQLHPDDLALPSSPHRGAS